MKWSSYKDAEDFCKQMNMTMQQALEFVKKELEKTDNETKK